MLDLHLTEDGSSVVRHGNFAIGGDENFVEPYVICLSFPMIFRVRWENLLVLTMSG